jgi:flagellar protein FliO/FliZ
MRALPLVICSPCPARPMVQTWPPVPDFSMAGSFLQMLAALAIVIGVIFFAQHMINRLLKGNLVKKSVPRYIRVVESRFLAPKKSLMLVEVGGEYLLLGTTDSGVNLIKQIDMLESIEVVEDLSAPLRPGMVLPDALQNVAELLRKKLTGFGRAEKRMV